MTAPLCDEAQRETRKEEVWEMSVRDDNARKRRMFLTVFARILIGRSNE